MYKKNKIGIVILNYKDSDTVINLCQLIQGYTTIDKIVIVDNRSPDDSYKRLKYLESEKIDVLITDKNGGYSYGNNYGAFYLIDKYDIDILFIANPDVEFKEELVISISEILDRGNIQAASGMMLLPDGREGTLIKHPKNYIEDLLSCTIFLKKFFLKKVELVSLGQGIISVDILPGSFFGIDTKVFREIGGFDDGVFLYSEEEILASKFCKYGYKYAIDTSVTYVHMEAVSITKSISYIKKISQIYKSQLYYYKNYTDIGVCKLYLLKIFMIYGLFVRKIFYPLRNLLK